jgi:hypothetical protein
VIEQRNFNVMRDRRIRLMECETLGAIARAPRLVSVRGVLVSALLCVALLGLLAIGAK